MALNTGDLLAQRLNHDSRHAVSATAASPASPSYCSIKTLKGTYSYAVQGYERSSAFGESGMETYDGKGKIIGLGSESANPDNIPFKGTYTVEANCTGALDYGDGNIYNIYVRPDGSGFSFLDRTPGNTLVGEETRISRKLILK